MALDPEIKSLLEKENLFLGVSAAEAQANYEKLRALYGRHMRKSPNGQLEETGSYLLDNYFETLTAAVDAPTLDWFSLDGQGFDEARHAISQKVIETAGQSSKGWLNNVINYQSNYLMDFGRCDLYGEERAVHGILQTGDDYGLTKEDASNLHMATAQMLGEEKDAQQGYAAIKTVHGDLIKAVELALPKEPLEEIDLLSRPLVELAVLTFRNRAYELMTGKPETKSTDKIKNHEPAAYNFQLSKQIITKEAYVHYRLEDKLQETYKAEINVRSLPKFPSPK